MLVHWTTLDFAFPELDYFGYFQNETHWNSKSLLIWMMFRHVGWQVPGLSWFFTSLHSWKSLGCLQVPLVLFSVTWVHWPVCGVAPWLRAPRSLDEARGMKPSKAPRVETYPYGPIPKKLDDDVEEDEHPGKKKKDSDGIWDEGLNMSLRPKKVLKLRIELLMVLILPVIQLSMDCGVSTGILVWFWALVFFVFQDVSCIFSKRSTPPGAKKERYRIFSDASVSWWCFPISILFRQGGRRLTVNFQNQGLWNSPTENHDVKWSVISVRFMHRAFIPSIWIHLIFSIQLALKWIFCCGTISTFETLPQKQRLFRTHMVSKMVGSCHCFLFQDDARQMWNKWRCWCLPSEMCLLCV